jgi:putative MATE family efflux protein
MKRLQCFGDRTFLRLALTITVPIILQNLLTTSFSLIDTLMISSLGTIPLTSVGLAAAWLQFHTVVLFGITSGQGVLIAQYWGAQDHRSIRRSYGLGLTLSLFAGCVYLLITALAPNFVMSLFSSDPDVIAAGSAYLRIIAFSTPALALNTSWAAALRSTEEVRIPLYGSILSVVVNITLNYILIFGHFGAPALGLPGAAIASTVANWLGAGLVFFLAWRKKTVLRAPVREIFSFSRTFCGKYFPTAFPIMLNEIIWGGGTMVLNAIYGHMGTVEYAALTLFRTVDNLVMVLFLSMFSACAVLVGKELGSGNRDRAWKNAVALNCWTVTLAVICAVLVILLRHPIVALFQQTPEVVALALPLLVLGATEMPLHYFNYNNICGVFRAGADGKTAAFYDFLGVWVISMPLALAGLALGLPFLVVYGVVIYADNGVKLILVIRRFRSKKWMKSVTEE